MRLGLALLSFVIAFFSKIDYGILTSSLHIEKHPKNITARIGENVSMTCIFNKAVNCVWKRNNKTKYNLSEKKSKTCSHTRNVTQSDFTVWECCHTDMKEGQSSFICSNAWISETIIPSETAIKAGNGRRIQRISCDELVNMNITCVSKYGNPAPKLSWELNGEIEHARDPVIFTNSENNYTSALKWNFTEECHPSTLNCCLEHPGLENKTCETLLIDASPLVNLSIEFDAKNVSQINIHLNTSVNPLGNLTCSYAHPCCGSAHPPFQLKWIIGEQYVAGTAKNASDCTLGWDTTINWRQFVNKDKLECQATNSSNHSHIITRGVLLQWHENTGHSKNATDTNRLNIPVIAVFPVTTIILTTIVYILIRICITKKGDTPVPHTSNHPGTGTEVAVTCSPMVAEPIYEEVDYMKCRHIPTAVRNNIDANGYLIPIQANKQRIMQ